MDLTGQVLIAMPGMDDPRFVRSVVFICAHSDEGAMGVVINKHVGDMTLREVFSRIKIDANDGPLSTPVHFGGPVETKRGFVLHMDESRHAPEPLLIPGGFVLTATRDILEDIAMNRGPAPFLFAVGYAGWGVGQLESEIAQNGWLTAPASTALVFETEHDLMWDAALRCIGIDPVSLSGSAGRA